MIPGAHLAEAMARRGPAPRAGRRRLVWHYCRGAALRRILRARVLRPGTTVRGELPGCWFSARQDWDPAVGAGSEPSAQELAPVLDALHAGGVSAAVATLRKTVRRSPADFGGLARIGVAPEVARLTWADFVRMGAIPAEAAEAREAVDRELGSNPDDWRISLESVPAAKWIAVETRSGMTPGERWEPVPDWR